MTKVEVDFPGQKAKVYFDRSNCVLEMDEKSVGPVDMLALSLAVEHAGYSVCWGTGQLHLGVLKIEGMTCGHCSSAIQKAVESTKEAHLCRVSLDRHECYVIATRNCNFNHIVAAIESVGYLATVVQCNREVSLKIPAWVSVCTSLLII